MKTIISLGAGVQSSTMALMAAKGEIGPMPDAAIFADTGWEPKKIYEWLDWLEKQLPFPVYRVSAGNIRDDLMAPAETRRRIAAVPFYLDMSIGAAISRRQCTKEYKIVPIERKAREIAGLKKGERCTEIRVEQWIGISLDEIQRMKGPRKKWTKHRWPLVEQRMTRHDCLNWMAKNNYPTPEKSSCIGCPYHSDTHWAEMKVNAPDEWADAIAVDNAVRGGGTVASRGIKGKQYMHRSLIPLEHVDLRSEEDKGQLPFQFGFANECEGMCGV